jgi:hypothetical protein
MLPIPGSTTFAFADPLLFAIPGRRLLPALIFFAILAPGFRSRKLAPPPLEAVQPDAVRLLRSLQRDASARFVMNAARQAALAIEYGNEGNLLIHYISSPAGEGSRKLLTIAGGWLGAGRRRYMWIPLRPTMAWNPPSGQNLSAEEITELAADLHAGLDEVGERHVIEAFLEPAPIPLAERREVLDSYASFMHSHGWQVSYDEQLTRRSLKRTETADSPQNWSIADREALTRLEALVSEMLKGVRSSSRILFQTK